MHEEQSSGTESIGTASELEVELSNPLPKPIHQPVFVGSAREYFRIWVVNMLFSLLTLGIWSAWATVRNRRYLYGNTEFAGNRFDFHGNPVSILRGRLLAVVFFSAYAFGGDFHYAIPVIAFLLLIVLFPWMLVSAMRFRLSNTSWRNLRFGFTATTKKAYAWLGGLTACIFILYGIFFLQFLWLDESVSEEPSMLPFLISSLLFVAASFVLVPLTVYRIRYLVMNHIRYGEQTFLAKIQASRFFRVYGKSLLIGIVAIGAGSLIIGGLISVLWVSDNDMNSTYALMILVYATMVPVYLLPFAVWKVGITNYVFNSTVVDGLKFSMKMKVWPYWWIVLSNAFLALVTLGLAIPWTKIRVIRYMLSSLSVNGEIGVYQGTNVGKQSAAADEIGDAFDIDFGF